MSVPRSCRRPVFLTQIEHAQGVSESSGSDSSPSSGVSSFSELESCRDDGEVEAETRRTASGRESSLGDGRGEVVRRGESERFGGARLVDGGLAFEESVLVSGVGAMEARVRE